MSQGSKVTYKKGFKSPEISYKKKPVDQLSLSSEKFSEFSLPGGEADGNQLNVTSTPGIVGTDTKTITTNKSIYGNFAINKNLDTTFTELISSDVGKDVTFLFRLYEELFFDIPRKGERNSHETLFLRSRDYLRGFVDPKDAEIESLTDQIEELLKRILELEGRSPIEVDGEGLAEFSSQIEAATAELQETLETTTEEIAETIEEIEEDIAEVVEEVMTDDNNDGIPDNQQQFANYGNPKRVILVTGKSELDGPLSLPNYKYYKDKYYGRKIYKFKKKVDGKKNRLVLYDGAHGKKGKRYLIDFNSWKTHKIKKRHWKSKNYNKLYG